MPRLPLRVSPAVASAEVLQPSEFDSEPHTAPELQLNLTGRAIGAPTTLPDPDALSPELRAEIYDVGERRGHYQGFLNLLSHERQWSEARNHYPQIRVPTLLIYGEQDWAPVAQRERTGGLIPGVVVTTVADGSHFLSLDRPAELTDLIVGFFARTSAPRGGQS